MTLKTQKFREKNQTFLQKTILENILIYFQKISAKILRFWSKHTQKKADFTRFWQN